MARLEQQRQACALVGQGLQKDWPAARALRLAAATCPDPQLREALLRGARRSDGGATLAEALADAGLPVALREAAAGCPRGAGAGEVLESLAGAALASRRVRRELWAAGIYPVFVLVCAIGAGVAVIWHVLPLVQQWHHEAWNTTLPLPALARGLELALGPWGLTGFALLALLLALLWRRGGLGWRMTLFRPLVAATRAGLTRALATLLRAGQPLPDSLGRIAAACNDRYARRALLRVRAAVEQGGSLSEAMVDTYLLPAAWAGPLSAAERGGKLDASLAGVSQGLALEARLGAATWSVWVLTIGTLLAGGLVLWIGLSLFGALTWSS